MDVACRPRQRRPRVGSSRGKADGRTLRGQSTYDGRVAGHFIPIDVTPYQRQLVRSARGFASGNADLDEWLRQYSGQSERSNNTRTFLGVVADGGQVVGFYTTTTYRIERDEQAEYLEAGNRAYPIPAVLLARLAVDKHWQGLGIGRQLLVDAMQRFAALSADVGFEVVVVDAIDDEAITFYSRYGFVPFQQHRRRLFLTTKQLLETFPISD